MLEKNSNSLFKSEPSSDSFREPKKRQAMQSEPVPIAKYYFSADESTSYWDVQDAFLQEQEKKESQSEPGSDWEIFEDSTVAGGFLRTKNHIT